MPEPGAAGAVVVFDRSIGHAMDDARAPRRDAVDTSRLTRGFHRGYSGVMFSIDRSITPDREAPA
jgi:hypothetical protein